MRIGVISDIHGNLEALEAVLAHAASLEAGSPERWVCLGDTVGYGPNPNECVSRVRELCSTVLIGNHDLAAIHRLDINWFNPFARAAAEWTRTALSPESISFLESLPETTVEADEGVTFAHGSLTDPPRDYITNRREARENFSLLTTPLLFIGHSHLSHCFIQAESGAIDEEVFQGGAHLTLRSADRYIINCGSVGQPRDHNPRSAFGVIDLQERVVDVYRVEYDIAAVRARMLAERLPAFLADRLARGM